MLTRIIAGIISPFVSLSRYIDEKILGLDVKINKMEPGWMHGFVINSMDLLWRPMKLTGINYWTIGNINENNKSTRYDEKSRYFQAWFGFYLAKSKNHFGIENGNIKILDYNKMGIADQNNWLRLHMDPIASTVLDPNTVKFIKKFKIASGQTCYLFSGEYMTDSDNSNRVNNFVIDIFSRVVYKQFNGKKDFFNYTVFSPKYTENSFKIIRLKGYFGIVPFFRKQKHVIFYGCGTKKNFDKLKEEILSMMKSAEIKTNM